MNSLTRRAGFWLASVLTLQVFSSSTFAAEEVTVYTSRQPQLIKPLFDAFTRDTGIAVKYLSAESGTLISRIEREDRLSPADVLMTVDIGMLALATERQLLSPVQSDILQRNVPAYLRDSSERWIALTRRSRTLVYHQDKVKPEALTRYADLSAPTWRNRICLTSSKKAYNISLIAMLIDRLGEEKTEQVVSAWVQNLATAPLSTDTAVLEAVEAGQCDAGIVNSYYYSRYKQTNKDTSLRLAWPEQGLGGVHENISGAGITRHAPQRDLAIELLEWLSSKKAQTLFANLNFEHPVNPKAKPNKSVRRLGRFEADEKPIGRLRDLQVPAAKLMDRAGYR